MTETEESEHKYEDLRMTVRMFYDLQELRIGTTHRSTSDTADLEDGDQSWMAEAGDRLRDLEKGTLREVGKLLRDIPIYQEFLADVKGVGPTMAGVIISEIDITKAPTPSALWSYCGLSVDETTGEAVRRKRGEKSNWNPLVKTKMVGVLVDCIMKADGISRAAAMGEAIDIKKGEDWLGSQEYADFMKKEFDVSLKMRKYKDEKRKDDVTFPANAEHKKLLVEHWSLAYRKFWKRDPWVPIYEGYKHRKENQLGPCKACSDVHGPTGKVKKLDAAGNPIKEKGKLVLTTCMNCNGTLKGPWGKSKAHRHNAAKRYMIKMFLLELWKVWRELEDLEVVPSYAEGKLGIVHHESSASAHA